jgi:hypothetical protein
VPSSQFKYKIFRSRTYELQSLRKNNPQIVFCASFSTHFCMTQHPCFWQAVCAQSLLRGKWATLIRKSIFSGSESSKWYGCHLSLLKVVKSCFWASFINESLSHAVTKWVHYKKMLDFSFKNDCDYFFIFLVDHLLKKSATVLISSEEKRIFDLLEQTCSR